MPRDGSLNLRISPAARRNLTLLVKTMDSSQTEAVEEAITHLLSTLLRDLPVYRTLPPGSVPRDPEVA